MELREGFGSLGDLQDTIGISKWTPGGGSWTSKWMSGGPFGPQNGDLGGLPKNERQTMKLSTRAHDLYLEICVSTRPNIDEAKRV